MSHVSLWERAHNTISSLQRTWIALSGCLNGKRSNQMTLSMLLPWMIALLTLAIHMGDLASARTLTHRGPTEHRALRRLQACVRVNVARQTTRYVSPEELFLRFSILSHNNHLSSEFHSKTARSTRSYLSDLEQLSSTFSFCSHAANKPNLGIQQYPARNINPTQPGFMITLAHFNQCNNLGGPRRFYDSHA